jgi:hypothetical protein
MLLAFSFSRRRGFSHGGLQHRRFLPEFNEDAKPKRTRIINPNQPLLSELRPDSSDVDELIKKPLPIDEDHLNR